MKNILIIVLVSLVVGGGIGYLVGGSKGHPDGSVSQNANTVHGTSTDSMVMELSELSGSDRDEAYLESMIVHHQSAVDMSEILLETTRRPELKQLAESVIATQNTEIAQMKSWLSQWYGR
jgi:uncharacterized protein (DUF305 family)